MAGGYQEADRSIGQQQPAGRAANAVALPRPPVQASSPFSSNPAPSEATPLVAMSLPSGGTEERRARSPLRYVILVLGLGLVVSCGIFGLVRSSPSALGLDTRGPDAVGGDEGALAREGGSWKMPKKQLTAAPTPAPTPSPTPSPTLPALKENLALGVCWAPRAEMKDPEEIEKDALLIRRHFRQVRTFYSSFYQTPVLPYFVRAGLRVALGVFLYEDQPEWSEAEKRVAIESSLQHPEHTIAIYVGNEDLVPFGTYTVDDLIGHMADIRKGGVKTPVGTVQRMTEWLMGDPSMDRLAEACDVIGVNVYPFFSAGNEDLPTQWAKMLKRYPQHVEKIRLTETGWPSNGSPNFANQTATFGQAESFYHDYLKWSCEEASHETFYYAYFDGRAPTKAPDYEQWFGIVDPDGKPKYSNLADGFCPSETRLKEAAAVLEREAAAATAKEEQEHEGEDGRAH